MNQPPPTEESPAPTRLGSSLRRFMYWLAGARWETLRLCPPAERERIAVLGSTILIPTTMAFFGMYFYARSRFAEPQIQLCLVGALAWALIILGTDRILLATYRPFQPWWRKCLQVLFRFGLAAVISVAISFPFCLDQYRPAIAHRYQTETQGVLDQLRDEESTTRRLLLDRHQSEHTALVAQLTPLQESILNTDAYADEKIEAEKKRLTAEEFVPPASLATRQLVSQLEAAREKTATLQADQTTLESLHRRLVEAIAREMAGQPNEFFPEPKKAGQGPRTKDLQRRDQETTAELKRLSAAVAQLTTEINTLNGSLATARLADRNALLESLPERRAAFVQEAVEKERVRLERLQRLTAEITLHSENHTRALRLHDDRYLPPIGRYEAKIKGLLDPMEETIGLYKVIFLPAPDASQTEIGEQGYKWIAGLFQFLVIFGTLFVLDLIPIMAKIFSRPGPYDVLVEQAEMVAHLNLLAFKKHYPAQAALWATRGPGGPPPSPAEVLQTHSHPALLPASPPLAATTTRPA